MLGWAWPAEQRADCPVGADTRPACGLFGAVYGEGDHVDAGGADRMAATGARSSSSAGVRPVWSRTALTLATKSEACTWEGVRFTTTGATLRPKRWRHDTACPAASHNNH